MGTHRRGTRRQPDVIGSPRTLGVALASVVLLTAGCSGSDDADGGADPEDTIAEQPVAQTTAPPTTAAPVPRDTSSLGGTTFEWVTSVDQATVSQRPPTGINGFAILDDHVVFADLGGDEVLLARMSDGYVIARWQVPGPDDVAVDDDGTIYATGFVDGVLYRIGPDDTEPAAVATVGTGLNPIVLDGDDAIVARAVTEVGLFRVDVTDGSVEAIDDTLSGLNSFDLDGGELVSPFSTTAELSDAIARIDPNNGAVTVLSTGLGFPTAVKVRSGVAYLLAAVPPALYTGSATSPGSLSLVAELPDAGDNVWVESSGEVWVSSFNSPELWKVSSSGIEPRPIGAVPPVEEPAS